MTDARPSQFLNLTTTTDWENLMAVMGIWDGVDSTSSFVPTLSGSSILMGAGQCIIKGQLWDQAAQTQYTPTKPVTNPRMDILVIGLNRGATTQQTVVSAYIISGAESTTSPPPAPHLTQSTAVGGKWEIPVCQYVIAPSGVITSVTDVRQFAGHTVVAMLSGSRPSPAHPRIGLETDTGYLLRWDGTNWGNLGPKNQVNTTGLGVTGTSPQPLHTAFPIPANDAALGDVCYRLRVGGGGHQSAGVASNFGWQVNAFGLNWGAISGGLPLPVGCTFNWDIDVELLISKNGNGSLYGNVTFTQSGVSNPGVAQGTLVMQQQRPANSVNVAPVTTIGAQAWIIPGTGVTTAASLTGIGSTYERIAD